MSGAPKHVLVPVDVDPAADLTIAERLVDDAVDLAKPFGAQITIVHVTVPTTAPLGAPPIELAGEAYRAVLAADEARAATAGKVLGELATRAIGRGIPTQTLVTTSARSIAKSIVDTASDLGADLITIATHGRRGLARFLLGSVAERTAHLAHVPVLLIPAHER